MVITKKNLEVEEAFGMLHKIIKKYKSKHSVSYSDGHYAYFYGSGVSASVAPSVDKYNFYITSSVKTEDELNNSLL